MSASNLFHNLKRKHEAILTDIKAFEKSIAATHKHMANLAEREEAVAKLYVDLAHVVAVIRMDYPDYDESAAKARGRNTYKLKMPIGQCTRFAFEIIRETADPMTINQVGVEVLRRSGVADPDSETVRLICNNINSSFRARFGNVLDHDEQYPQHWWVIGSNADPKRS